MRSALPRRSLLIAAGALAARPRPAAADLAGDDAIARLERQSGGRLGVFALDTGSGRTLAYRPNERFLMQSTFKGPLAAMVLWRIDAGRDRLEARVEYGAADLRPHSPLTEAALARAHGARGVMSVGDLCTAILEQSDNAAANLLLARVGGPAALTRFVRRLGDPVTRFDRYELVGGWSGTKDTTTPRAMAAFARKSVLGSVLAAASRRRLRDGMARCVAGRGRLRAGLPADWQVVDRTGTGDGVCNDYAVAWPPTGRPLVIAAYSESKTLPLDRQEAVLRDVGQAVARWQAGA